MTDRERNKRFAEAIGWTAITSDGIGRPPWSNRHGADDCQIPEFTANNHPLCKLCEKRPKPFFATYHPDSWCYMFRDGEHVFPSGQGWCAQFTQDRGAIAVQLKSLNHH